MLRHLPAGALGPQSIATQAFSTYCIGAGRTDPLPADVTFDDLFRPDFWMHHQGTHSTALRVGDVVRVRAADGSFDVDLNVLSTPVGGIIMELRHKYPTGTGTQAGIDAVVAAEQARPRVVPFLPNGKPAVRVEPVGKRWRVFALNQAELGVHDTEGEALKAMDKYLADLRYELPSPAEIAKKAQEAEEAAEKRRAAARLQQASARTRM